MRRSPYRAGQRKRNLKRAFILCTLLFIYVYNTSRVYAQAELYRQRIKYLTSISDAGAQIKIRQPRDVYIDTRDDIYCLDSLINMVLIYDKEFTYISRINVASVNAIPQCLCVDQEGHIYVGKIMDTRTMRLGKISKFDTLGRLLEDTEFKNLDSFKEQKIEEFAAFDMAIDANNNLFLAGGRHGLVIIDAEKKIKQQIRPKEIKKYPKTKEEKEVYSSITHVAIDLQNRVYLLSKDEDRCYVYTRDGEFLFKFGKGTGAPGGFSFPHGLCADNTHKMILVMDYMRHTLLFFSMADGGFIGEFGGMGDSPGWFNYPGSICINKDDSRLCIADILNNRFQVFVIKE